MTKEKLQVICDVLNYKIQFPSDEQLLWTMDYLIELQFYAHETNNDMMSLWAVQKWYSYSITAQARELKYNFISQFGTPEWIEH